MNTLIMAILFLFGNFVYQLLQVAPDYFVAIERSFFQALAMVFIVFTLN